VKNCFKVLVRNCSQPNVMYWSSICREAFWKPAKIESA